MKFLYSDGDKGVAKKLAQVLHIDFEHLNEPFIIYNSIGQMVLRGHVSESIDLQSFINGIYWLKVGEKWAKFVKE